MSMDHLHPYSELVRMAEHERELIAAGSWEELVRLGGRRAELAATLPARPPAEARDLLETASRQIAANAVALEGARERTGRDISRVGTARQALRGYGMHEPERRLDVHR